jgi:phospholipase C
MEPNISAWRRAVCGDLTSAFNFGHAKDDAFFQSLPSTVALANRARALPKRTTPADPTSLALPQQDMGLRPSRALPYELHVHSRVRSHAARQSGPTVDLVFANTGRAAAVFHVYDRLRLGELPRRYTVEAGKRLKGQWQPGPNGTYDLWVLGPNGFHRHFTGNAQLALGDDRARPDVEVGYDADSRELVIKLVNEGGAPCVFTLQPNAYFNATAGAVQSVVARGEHRITRSLQSSANWYDFTVKVHKLQGYSRRFAGRLENGLPSLSDPAMGGVAIAQQLPIGG